MVQDVRGCNNFACREYTQVRIVLEYKICYPKRHGSEFRVPDGF